MAGAAGVVVAVAGAVVFLAGVRLAGVFFAGAVFLAGVVALVFNDRAYGALKTVQDRRFGGRRIGIDLGDTDFPALARAVGADGVRVSSPAELGPALREAVEQRAATLIELPLDVQGRAAIPPWMPE